MIDSITTIGDAGDINCWSGIPHHFSGAARAAGFRAEPWRIDLGRFAWPRKIWNLAQTLLGRGRGGFQYSDAFARRALADIEPRLLSGRVVSFNQHFPPVSPILKHGGKLCLYLDATFPLLLDRYGLAKVLPPAVQAECLEKEREVFSRAEWLVFFQRWSAESAVRDCGADPARVRVICPGANLTLPSDWKFAAARERPSSARPLVLGFVGKDWRRKGLPFLLTVRRHLVAAGVPTVVRCAGGIPSDLPADSGVEHWGFIDKHREPARFLDFLAGCDLGCLFSNAEASSIAVLEFLRAGVPVAGFVVDGMVDLFPPDAGFRFEPGTSAETVAGMVRSAFGDAATIGQMRAAARAWSPQVTWERCVSEWGELLATGAIKHPVRLWHGREAQPA
jgi:glycosyltransferase involved in cell wall biosynthesis